MCVQKSAGELQKRTRTRPKKRIEKRIEKQIKKQIRNRSNRKKVCKSLQKIVENLHNPFRKEVKLEMRHQRRPEPEEKTINSIPVRIPVTHLQETSHSSRRTFFRYSDIEAAPANYELDSDSVSVAYTFPINTGLPSEISLTMEDPYAYLRSVQKHSLSTGIPKSGKKKKPETKIPAKTSTIKTPIKRCTNPKNFLQ